MRAPLHRCLPAAPHFLPSLMQSGTWDGPRAPCCPWTHPWPPSSQVLTYLGPGALQGSEPNSPTSWTLPATPPPARAPVSSHLNTSSLRSRARLGVHALAVPSLLVRCKSAPRTSRSNPNVTTSEKPSVTTPGVQLLPHLSCYRKCRSAALLLVYTARPLQQTLQESLQQQQQQQHHFPGAH